MLDIFASWFSELMFIFQRLDAQSVLDIGLVTLVFFFILVTIRSSQAAALLRGVLILIALIGLLNSLQILPAFSWLIRTTFPALLLAIPVIFSPEIRRALERLGRAGQFMTTASLKGNTITMRSINNLVTAVQRLALRKHGALIIIQRSDNLDEYIKTGVLLNAVVTPELILQVFYPNTPLHDGAAIIQSNVLVAAACVMPLSSSGALDNSPEHRMGLRHRAALGISEASDATAIVVSEETGSISLAQNGKMIRNLDPARLENILRAFFVTEESENFITRVARRLFSSSQEATWNKP